MPGVLGTDSIASTVCGEKVHCSTWYISSDFAPQEPSGGLYISINIFHWPDGGRVLRGPALQGGVLRLGVMWLSNRVPAESLSPGWAVGSLTDMVVDRDGGKLNLIEVRPRCWRQSSGILTVNNVASAAVKGRTAVPHIR